MSKFEAWSIIGLLAAAIAVVAVFSINFTMTDLQRDEIIAQHKAQVAHYQSLFRK